MTNICFDFYTFDEILEITGFTKDYLYQLTSKRKIPFKKIGKKLSFPKDDIQEWLNQRTKRNTVEDAIKHTLGD